MTTGRIALSIAADHPAFAGHFPGQPIVPGVVLLDEALHAIGQTQALDFAGCQIGAVKFLSPVAPGEAVVVEFDMDTNGAVRFEIMCDERKIATGSVRVRAGA